MYACMKKFYIVPFKYLATALHMKPVYIRKPINFHLLGPG